MLEMPHHMLTVIANPDNIFPFPYDLYRCLATIVSGRAFTILYFVVDEDDDIVDYDDYADADYDDEWWW